MVYRVLSIDGGGIRGVFALNIIKFIQDEVDKDFLKKVDCFAGTSTGGLIATCLNIGYSPEKLLFYYKHLSGLAFRKNGKGNSKYTHDNLLKMLHTLVPKKLKFSDLKKGLIIPACSLYDDSKKRWQPKIYDTFSSLDENVGDIAMRSSSAPIYFPSYQGHIDGGVYAVNPSLLAYSRVIDRDGGDNKQDEIRLLSIGNGLNPTGIQGEIDWGLSDWMGDRHTLLELMTDMNMQAPHYPLMQILKDKYRRINSVLEDQVYMDDRNKINSLMKSASLFKDRDDKTWDKDKRWVKERFLESF